MFFNNRKRKNSDRVKITTSINDINKVNYFDEITEHLKNLTQYDDFNLRMIQCEKNRRNRYYVHFEQQQIIHKLDWQLNECAFKYDSNDFWDENDQFEMDTVKSIKSPKKLFD